MQMSNVRGVMAALSAGVLVAGAVFTAVSAARADSGVVVLDGACFLLDGNGAIVSGPRSGGVTEFETLEDGTVEARCRATAGPAADGGAREWSFELTGMSCTVQIAGRLMQTTDWRQAVDAQGSAELVCRAAL